MSVILFLILFVQFAPSETVAQAGSRAKDTRPYSTTSQSVLDQTVWEGTYTFQESEGRTAKGTGTFVEHTLRIYRQGNALLADIDANGFQTARSLRCETKTEGNKISFYFQSYREDHTFPEYRKGQLLLILEKASVGGRTRILTRWGSYQPIFNTAGNRRVYFRKTK